MKTVVVDPRRIGIGGQADMLLQVRPGTDGALALAMIHCLIEEIGTTLLSCGSGPMGRSC